MPSPLHHGQWHTATQRPQALAFQLSPELAQWGGGGGQDQGGLGAGRKRQMYWLEAHPLSAHVWRRLLKNAVTVQVDSGVDNMEPAP